MQFLHDALSGIALDDIQHPSQRRPDFSCLRGLLVIEVKSLVEDATQRISNVTEELEKREDWPIFYGAWPMDSVLRNLKDPDPVRWRMIERIGRAIKNHLKKASKQLAAYAADNPRLNQVRVVVLINEDLGIYHPNLVVPTIQEALVRQEDNVPKYKSIDAVLYMTERHAVRDDNNIAHPFITIPGRTMANSPWKNSVLEFLVRRWCQWEGARYIATDPTDPTAFVNSFVTLDHIPDQMRRQDAWRLAYRRSPYMRSWKYEELLELWDKLAILDMFALIKDSPIKRSDADIAKSLERFTHLLEEIAHRGLTAEMFDGESDRLIDAGKRMGIPSVGLAWLKGLSDEGKRSTRNKGS